MTAWMWGASEGGRLTLPLVTVDGVVDSSAERQGTTLGPHTVQSPDAIRPGDHVVIASLWARDIGREAERRGATISLTPLWRTLSAGQCVDDAAVDRVCHLLADERSRMVYVAAVWAWVTDRPMPAVLGEVGGYDAALFAPRPRDAILDGGPYDGAEIRQWLAAQPTITVTAVDPCPRPELLALAGADRRVRVVPVALAGSAGRATVHEAGPASGIHRADGEARRVDTIPLAALGHHDMVKLDIEGAEVETLDSARFWLARYRPRMAVCIYHRLSDLWTIPLLVHDALPTAALHVRHHSQGLPETVLYILPEGRS